MKQLWGCVVGLACLVGSAATAQSLEPVVTGTWIGSLRALAAESMVDDRVRARAVAGLRVNL